MSVIDFQQKKLERSHHISGTAVCLGCRHEWGLVAAHEYGKQPELQCPKCLTYRGVVQFNFAPKDNIYLYCDCGCEYYAIGVNGPMCIGCGTVVDYDAVRQDQ